MANPNNVHELRSIYNSHGGLEFSKKVDLEKHFLIENKKSPNEFALKVGIE